MREKKLGGRIWLGLGLVAALIAMAFLQSTDNVLQYAVASPNGESDIKQALDARGEMLNELSDCTSALAVGAVSEKVSVSAGDQSDSAAVYAVGEGWFEVHPVFLKDGRRLTETELRQGDHVALLDADLAFELFGSELPEDAMVRIGNGEYQVVGTIRHTRSVGEKCDHCAYVPLTSEVSEKRNTLLMVARPIENSGAATMFESTVRTNWRDDGCFYNLEKETLRQMMLPRLLLLIFGMSVLFSLLRRMNRWLMGKVADYREKLRWNYFKKTISMLLGIGLGCLLGYGALLAALYGLMSFSIYPLTVFTEWVPENIVEWTSLKNVFWNLSNSAASLVKVGTREMRRVEFWGSILRWSVLSMLIGGLLMGKRKRQ